MAVTNGMGNYGSQQTANGVVELLSPLQMVWRRGIEWGGTAALSSDGISVTVTSTNLPKEGHVVKINSSGKAVALSANMATTDSGTTSLALVWVGYEVSDAAASDVVTVIDAPWYLFEISSDRVDAAYTLSAGRYVYYDGASQVFYGLDNTASGKTASTYGYACGVSEGATTRNGSTYYRVRWNRGINMGQL
jgi:hypothetical protein